MITGIGFESKKIWRLREEGGAAADGGTTRRCFSPKERVRFGILLFIALRSLRERSRIGGAPVPAIEPRPRMSSPFLTIKSVKQYSDPIQG
jgi:hypothetical protein